MSPATGGHERRDDVDLTVVSVAYGDKWCVDLNRSLADRLNPGDAGRWRVVRNLPARPEDAWSGAEPYEVVDGAVLPPEHALSGHSRSIHHALGLEHGSRDIATRFVLLMDADFFIVRDNWYRDVVDHMREGRIAFFGAPYHPRTPSKIRYFPCAVALCIDTERVGLAALDWLPRPAEPDRGLAGTWWRWALERTGSAWRLGVESSVDTGIAVYEQFRSRSDVRAECVVPVFTAADSRSRLQKKPAELLLEALLPDRYCAIPRRRGYFTDRRFATLGLPDTHTLGCEEYWWRDAPFAVHLRGAPDELRRDRGWVRDLLECHGKLAP